MSRNRGRQTVMHCATCGREFVRTHSNQKQCPACREMDLHSSGAAVPQKAPKKHRSCEDELAKAAAIQSAQGISYGKLVWLAASEGKTLDEYMRRDDRRGRPKAKKVPPS